MLYAAGLRSLGPVWSRNNIFGHGVPFAFPGGPDTGDGLTASGEKLVSACNEMKILVDLSHITEKGFWDVARALESAAGRDAFQCACAVRFAAKPDGPAAGRDPRYAGVWSV